MGALARLKDPEEPMKIRLACALGMAVSGWLGWAATPGPCPALAQDLSGLDALGSLHGGEVGDDTVGSIAGRFTAELRCAAGSKDPQRHFCPVSTLDRAGFAAPAETQAYLGLVVEMADGARVLPSLRERVRLSLLVVGPGAARIVDIKASDKSEEKELAKAAADVARIMKGRDKHATLVVSRGLLGYLQGEAGKAGRPLRVTARGAHFSGKIPARLYRLPDQPYGEAYAAIEKAPNGVFVSVYPAVAIRPSAK